VSQLQADVKTVIEQSVIKPSLPVNCESNKVNKDNPTSELRYYIHLSHIAKHLYEMNTKEVETKAHWKWLWSHRLVDGNKYGLARRHCIGSEVSVPCSP